MRRLVPAVLLVGAAGCHAIYDYGSTAAADRSVALGAADAARQDSGRADAAPRADRGLTDAPADSAASDLPPDADPDAAVVCLEPQPLVSGGACSEQNPSCAAAPPPPEDPDCDGLAADADGRPAECNALLFFDGFDTDPSARWTLAGDAAWSCGQVTVSNGKLALRGPLSAALGLAPIVQLRLRVTAAPAAGPYDLRLGVNIAGNQGLWCYVFHDGSYPRLRSAVDGIPGVAVSVLPSVGTTYMLQASLDAAMPVCRLLRADHTPYAAVAVPNFAPSTVGELRVEASGIAVIFDHVAVFAPLP